MHTSLLRSQKKANNKHKSSKDQKVILKKNKGAIYEIEQKTHRENEKKLKAASLKLLVTLISF